MLSIGQINDAYQEALGRYPTGDEVRRVESMGLDGDPGKFQLIGALKGQDPQTYAESAIAKAKEKAVNDAIAQRKITDFKNVDQYLKNNPLTLDDLFLEQTKQLVKEQVIEEPYFKEKLSNYIEDVETQRSRAQEDTTSIIEDINRKEREYLTTDKVNYQQTRQAALEGQTDTGTLGTGAGQRDLNIQDITRQNKLDSYLADADKAESNAQQNLQRTTENLDLSKKRFTTDLEREQQLRIESEIQQRKQEELDRRNTAFRQYVGSNVDPANVSNILYQYS